jgi:hypothetical protein
MRPALVFAGIGAAWIAGCLLLVGKDPPVVSEPTTPHPIPPMDPPAGPAAVRRWTKVGLPAVELRGGEVYRAEIDLPWAVPKAMISQADAEKKGAEMGFDRVQLWKSKPADWPGAPHEDAELFVEGRYVAKFREQTELPDAIVAAYAYRLG